MEELRRQACELVGIRLSKAQIAALALYERTLLEWNTRFNLTAIRDPKEVRVKHFLDSLSCLCVMRDTPMERVVDVGTGAGFPGLPLKIVCPSMHLALVESVGKKAEFCRYLVDYLSLKHVSVLQSRAEEVGQAAGQRESYDWALGRAVADMPVLAEYLLPLVRVGGKMLAMKGESGPAEAQNAEQAMHILGGRLAQLLPVSLPGVAQERYLVVVDKLAATPPQYPRRVGLPAKKPLMR